MLIKLIQIRFDPIRIRIDSIRFKFEFDSILFDQFESMNFMIRLDSTSNRFANQISNQIFFGTLSLTKSKQSAYPEEMRVTLSHPSSKLTICQITPQSKQKNKIK